jgi:hypothetical protein
MVRFTAPKMTGHALARENPTRVLRLADGAGHIMGTGVTVGGALGFEVVTLDGAGETLTLGHTRNIHHLPGLEDFRADGGSGLILAQHILTDAELGHADGGIDARLGEMTGHRLGDATGFALAIGDLEGS